MSAARQIQEGTDRFNAERNRLSRPFRLRCSIAAGRVGTGAEGSDPRLEALIERAAELRARAAPGDIVVTGELAAAGLLELRSLAPLPREAGKEPLFSWHAGLRARQRP